MSVEYTPELPDDILTRIKYLNEQPDDYDVNTEPIISLKEEDIGKFKPPEPVAMLEFVIHPISITERGDTSARTNESFFLMKAKFI